MFATEEQAKQFAERHTRRADLCMPLEWNDTVDAIVLTTPVGEYRITRTDDN